MKGLRKRDLERGRISQGTKWAVLFEKDAKSQKERKRMREKEGSGDAQAVLLLSNNFLYIQSFDYLINLLFRRRERLETNLKICNY